jgi:hypothetical protein
MEEPYDSDERYQHTSDLTRALHDALGDYVTRVEGDIRVIAVLEGSMLFLALVMDSCAQHRGDRPEDHQHYHAYVQAHLGVMERQAQQRRLDQG